MNLLYINWNVDPEIFNLFGISLRYYSCLFMIGIVLCYIVIKGIYKRENLYEIPRAYDSLPVYAILGIVIGARLGHCLFYEFDAFIKNPIYMMLPFERAVDGSFKFTGYRGLASHGGGIGLIICLYFYCRKYQIGFVKMLDIIAIVTPLGGGFIRLGNLMNSEIIGTPSTLPWAFVFEHIDNIPRHPAQLYEAIVYFGIFAVLYFVHLKDKIKLGKGFYLGLSMFFIFVFRFLFEFIKSEQVEFEKDMSLNMGQLLSIPFIVISIIIILYSLRKGKAL